MKIEIKTLLLSFVALWIASFFVFRTMNDWQTANNIGGSFGAVSALFSGAALAMAIYSMVLQQKQAREFERNTVAAEQRTMQVLEQQSRALGLIETSLKQQVHAGKVTALAIMLERYEKRIDTLRNWGYQSYNDEKHYQGGIDAAQRRVDELTKKIDDIGATP